MMCKNFIKFNRRQLIIIVGIFFITVSLMIGLSGAGSNWLDKGKNLLKTYEGSSGQSGLTIEEIGAGLKDALRVGSENVVAQLGRVDGFNTDPTIHIPLPKQLDSVKSVLDIPNIKKF